MDKFAVEEIVNEDDAAGGARPPGLVEKEVAEAVVDCSVFI